MGLEKIYGGIVPVSSERRTSSVKEDTSDTFARMLQNLRELKAADARDRSETEGDRGVVSVLSDGSIITRIYQGTKLISETMTRGSNPEEGKKLLSETTEQLKPPNALDEANPLLALKAAQSSAATAALVSTML